MNVFSHTGTGLQNLRECIIWTKQKYDFEPKIKKPFWKQMSVNFIERYCYLVCFTTYLKEEAPKGTIDIALQFTANWVACSIFTKKVSFFPGFEKTFVLWMDIRAEIREVIYQGMKNFEWKWNKTCNTILFLLGWLLFYEAVHQDVLLFFQHEYIASRYAWELRTVKVTLYVW